MAFHTRYFGYYSFNIHHYCSINNFNQPSKSGLNKEQRANLKKKIEYVYQTLNKDYYKKQSSDKLTQSAIDGMVKELKDPYSEYMTAEETKQFNEGVSGDFVGIGAEMQKKNEQISVTSPMKDSPAEKLVFNLKISSHK